MLKLVVSLAVLVAALAFCAAHPACLDGPATKVRHLNFASTIYVASLRFLCGSCFGEKRRNRRKSVVICALLLVFAESVVFDHPHTTFLNFHDPLSDKPRRSAASHFFHLCITLSKLVKTFLIFRKFNFLILFCFLQPDPPLRVCRGPQRTLLLRFQPRS